MSAEPNSTPTTATVSVDIDAPADRLYEMVADLPRMGEWSPECDRCDWLGGASEAAPGVKFKGRNRRGVRRWSTTGEIVVADPGKELTFDVSSVFGLPVARWSYTFDGTGSSTTVTESWEDLRGTFIKVLGRVGTGVGDRAAHNTVGMRATLEQLKAAAESAAV